MKVLISFAFALLAGGCDLGDPTFDTSGRIMGTTWSVKVVIGPGTPDPGIIESAVEAELERLDGIFSTYIDSSEISRFNRRASNDWFPVSADTASVVHAGLLISHRTDGAFDMAVGPLVDRWGFGPQGRPGRLPSGDEIETLVGRISGAGLEVRLSPPALRKLIPAARLDLSAIAKGYAVDAVARVLDRQGWTDYLVEIGGEVRGRGHRVDHDPWRVAIESPDPALSPLPRVVDLDNAAIATSGSYRNHYEMDGRRYSHTIDPRTGRPVEHAMVSVTVVAEDAMRADAWATAINVLGPVDGRAVAERDGIAVSMNWHEGDRLEAWLSPAFRAYMERAAHH